MNQGTFSDYHWVYPGAVSVGILITGSGYYGGYEYYGSGYGPVAGLFYSEIFVEGAHDTVCTRLSKN